MRIRRRLALLICTVGLFVISLCVVWCLQQTCDRLKALHTLPSSGWTKYTKGEHQSSCRVAEQQVKHKRYEIDHHHVLPYKWGSRLESKWFSCFVINPFWLLVLAHSRKSIIIFASFSFLLALQLSRREIVIKLTREKNGGRMRWKFITTPQLNREINTQVNTNWLSPVISPLASVSEELFALS